MSAGPLVVYNGTSGVANTGGDSLTEDLNIYYSVRDQPSALVRLCRLRFANTALCL
jgi:hypothetical protein